MSTDILQSIEIFFDRIRTTRALGAGTPETSYYDALKYLIDAIGSTLLPKVYCLSQLSNTGSGSPDFGLYTSDQLQRGEPRSGQPPSRGVIEMKAVSDDSLFTSQSPQISKYFTNYRSIIVTNLRGFQIIGEDSTGHPERLEKFVLAKTEAEFWKLAAVPTAAAKNVGQAFAEFLRRALTQKVALRQPKDVAWFLASYARDAKARVEAVGNLPALATVRSSLEEALGIEFNTETGDHFYRSTLVQTLFYGIFSAWVLWARLSPRPSAPFDWKSAHWHLTVPFVRTLFQQLASPTQLQPLGLTEVLDWTGSTLNRIDPTEFLASFDAGEAVQFFYEPFLDAFDPELRQQFGVWYTPTEIVRYMVARVDAALKNELGIPEGLAADNVYVLDPCCGTGGFLTEVLKTIHSNLSGHGLGDAISDRLREAARTRIFGFEIMPAPFVVAHLQVGLALTSLKSSLGPEERAGIYLTNALTGWEPHVNKPLPFPELESERASADAIKQAKPILVILGNPPYNGFAGVATGEEERALSTAYRNVKKVDPPQGRGLNEVYVRFFRMAEKRITEKTGRGIICFVSNYSWLDGLSYTGMRERFLEIFDSISIDNLHGDRKASERAPDGHSSATVFAVRGQSPGIKVGTAIATLVRMIDHKSRTSIQYRDFDQSNADHRREALLSSVLTPQTGDAYTNFEPSLQLKLNFKLGDVKPGYVDWPKLPELLPLFFPGIQTSRDEFLVDIDLEALKSRISMYFDNAISDEELRRSYPMIMTSASRYSAASIRQYLRKRGQIGGAFMRYAYRPFDVRWLYWDPDTKLLNEKREEYKPHAKPGNITIVSQQKPRGSWQSSQVIESISCLDLIDRGSSNFPCSVFDAITKEFIPNVSNSMAIWLAEKGLDHQQLTSHIIATLHAPSYGQGNAGALRVDWPRIPLPSSVEIFSKSAKLGAVVAMLLDADAEVDGVSNGALLPGLSSVGTPRGSDYSVTVGWGNSQVGRTGSAIVMPGPGKLMLRSWSTAQSAALESIASRHDMTTKAVQACIGEKAYDVFLNATTYWEAVPENVWNYMSGGYQVLKKWLAYREADVLGRSLSFQEVLHFAGLARRISELLVAGPALDSIHAEVCADVVKWRDGRPV